MIISESFDSDIFIYNVFYIMIGLLRAKHAYATMKSDNNKNRAFWLNRVFSWNINERPN